MTDKYTAALDEADYFFDADEWEFTTTDESLVLDYIGDSETGIIRMGRFKRLPDKFVADIYNESEDEYERKYFDSFEEADTALKVERGEDE